MFLTVINPNGQASSLDLSALPVWRIELMCFGTDKDRPDVKPFLGLALRYVVSGQIAHAFIACMDCKAEAGELDAVVKVGLPSTERTGNRERLRESLKVMHNSLPNNAAEVILANSAKLVDIYHDLLNVFFGQEVSPLASLSARYKGEFEGWRYALTDHRHQPWLNASSSSFGMGTAPSGNRPAPPADAPPAPGKKRGAPKQPADDGMGAPPPATAASAGEAVSASPGAEPQEAGEGSQEPKKDDLFS